MSLSENGNGNGMVMPVGPMYGNGGGMGMFGGEGGLFYIVILILFFMIIGNGWGGGNGNASTYVMDASNGVQRGFDQQAVMNGIYGLTTGMTNGFAGAEVSRCNSQANLLATLNNNQNASMAAMNGLAMSLQNCCCENRAATADLKYTVATEACSDRQAINAAVNDLKTTVTDGFRAVHDQMCQDKMDAKDDIIANLRTQLSMKDLAASQTAQTAQIVANNEMQTQALEHYLNPVPIPAYMVQNPNCCGQNFYNGCGCNA